MKRILYITIFIIPFVSCQEQLPEQSKDINVEEVKSHFQNSILPNLNGRMNNAAEIVWDLAEYRDISIGDALIFPIKDDRYVFFDNSSPFSYLPAEITSYALAYKLQGDIFIEKVNLIPHKKSNGFTGAILVESWEGNKLRYFEYEKGKLIGEFKISESDEQRGRIEEFVYSCTTTVYYSCWGEIPEDCVEVGRDEEVCVVKEVIQLAGPGTNGEDYGSGGDPNSNINMCPHPFLNGQYVECPESECPPGQEIYNNQCTPVCPEGFERMNDGNCVEKNRLAPCLGNPLEDMQITSSGASGKNGGRYGCVRGTSTCSKDPTATGAYHDGLDLTSNIGDNVYAIYSGTVVDVRSSFSPLQYKEYSYGNYVTVKSTINGETIKFKYNHLDYISVSIGQTVNSGMVLGKTGATGNAGGEGVTPHLHLQARKKVGSNWERKNPEDYLESEWDNNGNLISTPCG